MTLLYTYYSEIKNRFFLICLSWICVSLISYFYKETILFLLVSFTNLTVLSNFKPYFIFTNVTEIFSVYTQLIFFIANQIFIINIFYHILMFLSLGLYKYEYKNLKFAFKIFIITWIISIVILNKILIPITWNFFLSFQEQTNPKTVSLFFEAKLNEYLNYYVNLYYLCLLNCQVFVCIAIFINFISQDINKIKKFRKIFYYIFIIFSTLTTPPDVLSQLIVSFCLIFMYETLLVLKILKKIN